MHKHYIVTGASRGIGKAICCKLIDKGFHVIGIARHFDWKDKALLPISLDLSDLGAVTSQLQVLRYEISQLDGIICNAGRGRFGSLEEFSYAQIKQLVELNFLSHVYLIKTFLPFLKKQKRGDIVMIGSEAALAGKKQGSIYCATKFAMRGFCQALREECRACHIRVSLINPGMVLTDFFDHLDFSPGQERGEHILPEDVADIAAHIIQSRPGIVYDEINLTPQCKKVVKKK